MRKGRGGGKDKEEDTKGGDRKERDEERKGRRKGKGGGHEWRGSLM
jgi:hypothetical protein